MLPDSLFSFGMMHRTKCGCVVFRLAISLFNDSCVHTQWLCTSHKGVVVKAGCQRRLTIIECVVKVKQKFVTVSDATYTEMESKQIRRTSSFRMKVTGNFE